MDLRILNKKVVELFWSMQDLLQHAKPKEKVNLTKLMLYTTNNVIQAALCDAYRETYGNFPKEKSDWDYIVRKLMRTKKYGMPTYEETFHKVIEVTLVRMQKAHQNYTLHNDPKRRAPVAAVRDILTEFEDYLTDPNNNDP